MSSIVPVVLTDTDVDLANKYYGDASVTRVALDNAAKLVKRLKTGDLWLDPAFDGLHRDKPTDDYRHHLESVGAASLIGNPELVSRPKSNLPLIRPAVEAALTECARFNPKWISVPQLPLVSDGSRNALNRVLAEETKAWASKSEFKGKLVLPVIATHQEQTNKKTARTPKVQLVAQCQRLSGAEAIWVVESSLSDFEGSNTFARTRFQGIIDLHEEIKKAIPGHISIWGGPYWALNLVLWVRGLINLPVVAVGSGFQYNIPGGVLRSAKARVALTPLRRLAVASPDLSDWLDAVLHQKQMDLDDQRMQALRILRKHLSGLRIGDGWRYQVAEFYGKWVSYLEGLSPKGRSVGLYQDFSGAHVFGADLPLLPEHERPSQEPGEVAKIFMLFCL